MRDKPTDNYETIALIGNNAYHICFMKYLFSSQGIETLSSNEYGLEDISKEKILKSIANFFGTQGPILMDNNMLLKLLKKYDIPSNIKIPAFSSEDILKQLEMCLESDFVYVCNCNGNLDKYTMFMLGFLMAKNAEVCFWNYIDKSEWLISCMTNENRTIGELVQYPLDIVRSLAYPYLVKDIDSGLKPGKYGKLIVTEDRKMGVDTNTDFSLNISMQQEKGKCVSILGSLRKQYNSICEKSQQLNEKGYEVLAPKISNIKNDENGFIIFEGDISQEPTTIEKDFLEKCLKSEYIFVCNKDGYIGNTVAFEIGYLLANNKDIRFLEVPKDKWISDIINYYLNIDENHKSLTDDYTR